MQRIDDMENLFKRCKSFKLVLKLSLYMSLYFLMKVNIYSPLLKLTQDIFHYLRSFQNFFEKYVQYLLHGLKLL